MTATTNLTNNGRRDSRPSLSQQIDRLNLILDGLAEAIPATVADSVRDSVGVAVAEAVRATFLEIAGNPELMAQLRQAPAPAEPAKKPQSLTGRIGAFVGGAWRRLTHQCQAAGEVVAGTARKVGGAVDKLNRVWSLRPVLIALGVGSVFGAAVSLTSPWLSGVLSGISAAAATLGAQFAAFTRRMCARFSTT